MNQFLQIDFMNNKKKHIHVRETAPATAPAAKCLQPVAISGTFISSLTSKYVECRQKLII